MSSYQRHHEELLRVGRLKGWESLSAEGASNFRGSVDMFS